MADVEGPLTSIYRPGIKAPPELAYQLRREVANLLQREKADFPGAQPVSFGRHHLDELRNVDYYVCEKSDGVRYLLYLTLDEQGAEAHYLIDRKNDFYYATRSSLHFPRPEGDETFHKGTILDGEMVMDALPHGGGHVPQYLVFDCLALDGANLMPRELNKRLGYFRQQVYEPYQALLRKYPDERKYMPFFLEMKDMQVAYGIEMMFREVIPKLHHGNDGLIFTCLSTAYRPGTDPHILKWKSADENTVDFRWKLHFATVEPGPDDHDPDDITDPEPFIDYDSVPRAELLAFHGGTGPDAYRHFADLHLTADEWEELKALGEPLDERLVEAYMDDQKRWRFYRFRDDKTHGNHITVIRSVLDSIRDAVASSELLEEAKSIRDCWKRRHQQQQHQQHQHQHQHQGPGSAR